MRLIVTSIILGVATALASYLAATRVADSSAISTWFAGLSIVGGVAGIIFTAICLSKIAWRSADADSRAQQIADARLIQITGRVEQKGV